MDFVQELVSNFGHMATRKCKTCGEYKPFRDYDGSQWQKDHKKRQCNKCKPPNQAQTVAAATGTHAPTPVEQHGALGGQSAAVAGAGAAACDVGASADACFQRRFRGAPSHGCWSADARWWWCEEHRQGICVLLHGEYILALGVCRVSCESGVLSCCGHHLNLNCGLGAGRRAF